MALSAIFYVAFNPAWSDAALGQTGGETKKAAAPATKAASAVPKAKAESLPAASVSPAPAVAPSDAVVAPDVGGVADPSQTSKVESSQTFKDKNAEALLDVNRFPEIRARQAATAADIEAFKLMGANANAPIDKAVIERVVDFMIGKLTSHTNLNAILADPQKGVSSSNQANIKEIQDATATLLEPIFTARAQSNGQFLTVYNRILLAKLEPVLKNHLIARVQAMIVLGQGASPEAIKLYVSQIRDPKQTVWVKLWALEGIAKIKANGGGVLNAADEINAAKVIATDFLDDSTLEIPWPVKLRALSALGALRRGFVVSSPKKAEMANTAMRLLADPEERHEVRAEAARALGLMPITSAVPKYNYPLIAFATGQLTVDLATKINTCFSGDPKKARQLDQPDKARYLAALLVGPVYQAFDGVADARDSGLLHTGISGPPSSVQKTFELVTDVIKAVVPLLNAGPRQIPDMKKELTAKIAALKAYLGQNPPEDTHLVQNGPAFKVALDSVQPVAVPAVKLVSRPGGL